MADEAVLGRIRKLLKLAADTSTTPEEAALAAARAQELLYKHNLSVADVDAEEVVEVNRLNITESWRIVLAAVVAKHNSCHVLTFGTSLRFIGKRHDVQVVLYLFTYLSRVVQKGSQEAWTEYWTALNDPILGVHPSLKEPGRREQWLHSYRVGAVQTIAIRLEKQAKDRDAQQAFEAQALVGPTKDALVRTSAALVAWNNKLAQYVQDKYQPTHREFDETVLGGAFTQGVVAGKTVGLRQGLGSGVPRRQLKK